MTIKLNDNVSTTIIRINTAITDRISLTIYKKNSDYLNTPIVDISITMMK